MEQKSNGSVAGFLIPSLIGIFLFMIPVYYDEKWTVVVKIIADVISGAFGDFLPLLCLIIVTLSSVLGIAFLSKPNLITNYPMVKTTFSTTAIWVAIRLLGTIFIWLTFFEVGADDENSILGIITSGDNGGFVLHDLLSVLVVIFFPATVIGLRTFGIYRCTFNKNYAPNFHDSGTRGC